MCAWEEREEERRKEEVYKQHVCYHGHDYRAEPVFIHSSGNKNINTSKYNHTTFPQFKSLLLLSWEVHSAAALTDSHWPGGKLGHGNQQWCGEKTQRARCCAKAYRSPVLRHHAPKIGRLRIGLHGVPRVHANNGVRQGGGGCVEMWGFQNLTFRQCECFGSSHRFVLLGWWLGWAGGSEGHFHQAEVGTLGGSIRAD